MRHEEARAHHQDHIHAMLCASTAPPHPPHPCRLRSAAHLPQRRPEQRPAPVLAVHLLRCLHFAHSALFGR